jgi:putative tryptophan/tyrosine transport system substrate-binding protein
MSGIGRREVIAGSGAIVAAPLMARAQVPGRTWRIAAWHVSEMPASLAGDGQGRFHGFFQDLRRLGFVEGTNLTIDRYATEGRVDRYEATARQIVESRPNLIVSFSGPGTIMLLGMTRSIAIVQPSLSDPVAAGFVQSLARPGGNLTGFTIDGGLEIGGLRVQMLKEAEPSIGRIAYLTTPTTQADRAGFSLYEQAAGRFGIEFQVYAMERGYDEPGYRAVFAEFARRGVDSLYVSPAAEHISNRKPIIGLTAAAKLPAIYTYREYADDGGLMSYGASLADNYRKAAGYVARILNGERPGDLPIQQPTVFDFVVNVKTAKALGITLPESIMIRATEVIE